MTSTGSLTPRAAASAASRRGSQSDDGNAEIESLLEQQIELGSGRQPDDRMLVAVSGQNVEGLGADRSGGADYNESTFTHANR